MHESSITSTATKTSLWNLDFARWQICLKRSIWVTERKWGDVIPEELNYLYISDLKVGEQREEQVTERSRQPVGGVRC